MLKRVFPVFLALLAAVLLTAMGGKGGGFERAPRVDKNYSVVVVDASGTKINGEKFSWEGRTRFSGYLGMAEVNLPFDRLREVKVGEKKEKKVHVTAALADGSTVAFDIDSDSRCFGEAGFGSFMLPMDEIQEISFKGAKETTSEPRR